MSRKTFSAEFKQECVEFVVREGSQSANLLLSLYGISFIFFLLD